MKPHLVVSIFVFLALCAVAGGQAVRLEDSSDWWSISSERFHGPELKPQKIEIDPSNFKILGSFFHTVGFEGVAAKLGKAVIVERGDASTGRHQACYVSSARSPLVHLVFEFGEDESLFYIFAGGRDWKGSNYCVRSTQVSGNLSTASGLRLGLAPQQLEDILGHPDATVGDTLFYFRQVHKKSTPAEFEEQRKEYPEKLSDALAHEKFDFHTVEQYIVAKFANSKLYYLAVQTDEE